MVHLKYLVCNQRFIAFEEAITDLDTNIPIDYIMEVVKIVLACNMFEFDGKSISNVSGRLWD